jgi:hypothetical protein
MAKAKEVPERRLYSVKSVGLMTDFSEAQIWVMISPGPKGEPPVLDSVKIGGARRVTAESLERLITHGSPDKPRGRRAGVQPPESTDDLPAA